MWRTGPGAGAREPHELALARLERERQPGARRERRAPRPGGDHDGPARARRRSPRGRWRTPPPRHRRRPRTPSRTSRPAAPPRARAPGRSPAGRTGGRRGRSSRRARAGQLGLELAHLVRRRRSRAPGDAPAAPAAPARPPRSRRRGARSARPCARIRASSPSRCLELAVERQPGARQLQLRPGVLVGAQHVALAQAGRAARHRAAVEQRDARRRGPPARARPRRRRSRRRRRRRRVTARSRPGTGPRRRAGTGPSPVIHARPVISGTIAGRPADGRLRHDPAGEARADHRLVDEARRRPPARRGRAAAPSAPTCRSRTASGPASRGGSTSRRARRRRRGRARGRRRGGSRAIRGSSGWTGRSAALIAAMIARPRVDQRPRLRRVDLQPDRRPPAASA